MRKNPSNIEKKNPRGFGRNKIVKKIIIMSFHPQFSNWLKNYNSTNLHFRVIIFERENIHIKWKNRIFDNPRGSQGTKKAQKIVKYDPLISSIFFTRKNHFRTPHGLGGFEKKIVKSS